MGCSLCCSWNSPVGLGRIEDLPRLRPIWYVLCCAKLLQLCPTLCDTMDYSPTGYSVHGIFQTRVLEWVAISSSRGSSRLRDGTHVSCVGRPFSVSDIVPLNLYYCCNWLLVARVWLFVTPWAVACQAPLSMGNPRKEYWSELPSLTTKIF